MLFLCLGEFIASKRSNLPELIQIVVSFCSLYRLARRSEANPNVYFSIKTNFINLFFMFVLTTHLTRKCRAA